MVSKHFGFLRLRWVSRYLQRPVLLPRPLGPAPIAWGSLGGPDPTALASDWLPACRAAALGEVLVLALFSQPPAVGDYPCCVLVKREDKAREAGGGG